MCFFCTVFSASPLALKYHMILPALSSFLLPQRNIRKFGGAYLFEDEVASDRTFQHYFPFSAALLALTLAPGIAGCGRGCKASDIWATRWAGSCAWVRTPHHQENAVETSGIQACSANSRWIFQIFSDGVYFRFSTLLFSGQKHGLLL